MSGLIFADGEESLGPDEQVILAVPPWAAQELLPDLTAPDAFCAIVNAHFKIVPPAGAPLLVGLIGGTAEWIFAFPDRISVTVSAADRLVDMDTQELAALLWRDVAAVHRSRRSDCRLAGSSRRNARPSPPRRRRMPGVPPARRAGEPVPRRRLDRYRAARDHRGRACAPAKRPRHLVR